MLLGELQQLRRQHHEAARKLEDDPQLGLISPRSIAPT
jgi:hypothetical protein